ncbi:MAG: tetratricopeptide repeat protein [Acidobacteria bacterium]|nr:tetratricopeptide repeat protein [Acidobacteriota bacterium]
MKRCPECRRDYYDDTLLYCLDDGNALLEGPASGRAVGDEPATAILSVPPAVTGGLTQPTDETDVKTAIFQPPTTVGGSDSPEKRSFSARRAAKPLIAAAVAVVVLVGGFFGYRYFNSADGGQINSIAVMPFVNESKNEDVEYLSDGMTETLIKSLSNLKEMDVRPRSAVFRYKGKDTDLITIGKELKVQAILNGRVAQRGEQLLLSLELVDVAKNRVIWTEQYQRRQAELVLLQTEIAKDVSAKLSPRISGAEEENVTKQATADPAAYQAYLRGRYFWNKRTGDNINKAIEQYRAAVDRDPNYAMAYVGLAEAYSILADYASNAPADSLKRAEEFAKRALAIDRQMAEPHATLGNLYYNKWQWAESEAAYKRAIELNPNYATGYHWYSVLLLALGRPDEAANMIMRAQELDPLSLIINQNVAQIYRLKGDHEAVIELSRKINELDPNFPGGYFVVAWSYLKLGRNDEAIAAFQRSAELNGRLSNSISELGAAYAIAGRTKEARELITELEGRYARREAYGEHVGTIYAALGEKDKAFEWIEKDVAARIGALTEFRWVPRSEPLRDDPRFKDLLKRMGLPE